MAQTGYTPIQLYYSSTTTNAPLAANLAYGELAINITDGKLFYKDNANAIQVIGWKTVPISAGGTGQVTQQAAINALAGAVTSTYYLRGNGTNVVMSAIQVADVPTLNQNTTGSSGSVKSNATTGLMQITGPAAASTRVMTIPDANFTAARTDAAQSFTGNQSFLTSAVVGPNAKQTNNSFEVNADTSYAGFIQNTGSGTGGTPINPSTNYGLHIGWNRSNGNAESNLVWGSGVGALSDLVIAQWTGTTYSVHTTLKKGGELNVANGNIEIGTSGKGIDFSATPGTGTSELFADYEEGTWTPTLSSATGAITTVGAATGFYTKVGRLVTLNANVVITTNGTGATALLFGNLPYSISTTNTTGAGIEQAVSGKSLAISAYNSTTLYVTFYDFTYPGANNARIVVSVTYPI